MSSAEKANKTNGIIEAIKGVVLFLPRLITSMFKFIVEAFAELKSVSWLSFKDTVRLSVYILVFVVVMAVAFAITDTGFYELFKLITEVR